MQADDAAAIELAVAGNEDGFRLLLDRHGRAVYQLAFRITGRREDAEDVVQETFIKAFRQIGRFEARSSVSTWLYRIGANCAVDMLRRRQSRERSEDPAALDMRPANDRAPSALALVEADEIRRRIDAAMSALSARERAAFVMRHFQECSIDEIASALARRRDADALITLARAEADPELRTMLVRHISELADQSQAAAAFLAEVLQQ